MALAPIGDPRRPLQLAIRSSRLLGIVFTLIGVILFGVFMILRPFIGGRGFGTISIMRMMIGMVYFVPGVLYLIFSIFLGKRQPWAIIGAMVLAGLHGVLALGVFVMTLFRGNIIGLVVCLLWLLAMAQLLYHLSKSFESMRVDTEFSPRGFEPLAPGTYPIQPLPPPG